MAVRRHDDAAPTVRMPASGATRPPAATAAGRSSSGRPPRSAPALENDDLSVWQRIVVAIKRDPYGRTARQVEEVLETAAPYGVSKALSEVLARTRGHLEANECAEVARHIHACARALRPRRAGVRVAHRGPHRGLRGVSGGHASPSAALMIRMRRLSDRFAKMKAQRSAHPE